MKCYITVNCFLVINKLSCFMILYCRAEGLVLVFKYVRAPFSCEEEQRLNSGVKAISSENTVCDAFLFMHALRLLLYKKPSNKNVKWC